MKILACVHSSMLEGGANRAFLMVVDGLTRDYGAEIEVLVPENAGELCDELKKRKIPYHRYNAHPFYSIRHHDGLDFARRVYGYLNLFLSFSDAFRMSAKLKSKQYDIIYANTSSNPTSAFLAHVLHLPHVTHVREFIPASTDDQSLSPWHYKMICRWSERLIMISQAIYHAYEEYAFSGQLSLIPDAVITPRNLARHIHTRKNGELDLLLAGRFFKEKGHLEALAAMRQLVSRGLKNIHLHFAGSNYHSGAYYTKVLEAIRRLGLEESVFFHGEVRDMVSLRETMDVELMTSQREPFGLVTVEAMCSGLVVIGANTGGTLDLIEDGVNGLLYEQGNPEDLADIIQKVYEAPDLFERLSKGGYDYAQTHHLPEDNVRAVYQVLCDAIGSHRNNGCRKR